MVPIYFMVDFENVRSPGLQGAEYLEEGDCVVLFYSQACSRIEQRRWEQLLASGCQLELHCLKSTGKNALDFYIASRTGELYGSGYGGTTAIISNDKGFQAVRDYWQCCAAVHRNILLKPNLEQSLASSKENSARRAAVAEGLQMVGLEAEFGKYQERSRIRALLQKEFRDTAYETRIREIQDILERNRERKVIYLDSLKSFGKEDGIAIYHRIKEMLS